MQEVTNIRILEKESNRRGDLFGRLMTDLFIALGYDHARLNIHKSGREIDLSAEHRLEPRRAIAECKATAEPTGGADLNKFVGSLDVEHEDKRPVTGYFVSLSGFTETAIEQEKQRRRTTIITLTGEQVVSQLVEGRILVAKYRATELAGRLCAGVDYLVLDHEAELLAHERGWIWAVYYTQGKARRDVALIHSDGTPLARAIADEVIAADRGCGGDLHKLSCLNPAPPFGSDTDPQVAEALSAYRQYLTNECGFIHLDGLPAESDVGSRRLRLENLFVPLHLDVTTKVEGQEKKLERQHVGAILTDHPRVALLAAPGGGKSTLIKRLAIAYVDPARRAEVSDDLPEHQWLPLFFRCRELRNLARGSFAELLEALSQRELVRQHAPVFRACVDRALLAGRVLLLVDGLDEISDSGDRAAFVCTLRSALQAYPKIGMVMTSREAGFRHVAAHLDSICIHSTLSPFDAEDIRRLSVAWHREVVGDTEKVRDDAEQLAETIVRNDRIARLAINPLLLTTLLLVKRWVGALPTRRAVLYGKAVEVLLMTWNTEGHQPIPEEEALPQLCYVASSMMLDGVQKVSRPHLAQLLQDARDSLPTELGYVRSTVDQFIHRVEDRSSLLMMTGHDIEDGQLVEFFEFRHLTFQEFLTARAMVEGWHQNRQEEDALATVLEPYFEKEEWREVIPLAAVLGGKETEALIQRLTKTIGLLDSLDAKPGDNRLLFPLARCLADEAAARPQTIRAAIHQLVRFGWSLFHLDIPELSRGRYGEDFRAESRRALLAPSPDYVNARYALMAAVFWQTAFTNDPADYRRTTSRVVQLLSSSETISRCEGALEIVGLVFARRGNKTFRQWAVNSTSQFQSALVSMLYSSHLAEQHVASWALGLLARRGAQSLTDEPDALGRLFYIWQNSAEMKMRHVAAWAIASQPIVSRDTGSHFADVPPSLVERLVSTYERSEGAMDLPEKTAALVVTWYVRAVSDSKLAKFAADLLDEAIVEDRNEAQTLRELLKNLQFPETSQPSLSSKGLDWQDSEIVGDASDD